MGPSKYVDLILHLVGHILKLMIVASKLDFNW